jgi:hypothetical protein
VLDKELFQLRYVYLRCIIQVVELDQRVLSRLQAEPVRLSEVEAQARSAICWPMAVESMKRRAPHERVEDGAGSPARTCAFGALLLRQDKNDEAMRI